MIHDLKCCIEPFEAVLSGAKREEVRVSDRPFAVGDVLRLREVRLLQYSAACTQYTGREVSVLVTYLSPGGSWGLPADVCVMSIRGLGEVAQPLQDERATK